MLMAMSGIRNQSTQGKRTFDRERFCCQQFTSAASCLKPRHAQCDLSRNHRQTGTAHHLRHQQCRDHQVGRGKFMPPPRYIPPPTRTNVAKVFLLLDTTRPSQNVPPDLIRGNAMRLIRRSDRGLLHVEDPYVAARKVSSALMCGRYSLQGLPELLRTTYITQDSEIVEAVAASCNTDSGGPCAAILPECSLRGCSPPRWAMGRSTMTTICAR